jgi:hypothetical protein
MALRRQGKETQMANWTPGRSSGVAASAAMSNAASVERKIDQAFTRIEDIFARHPILES